MNNRRVKVAIKLNKRREKVAIKLNNRREKVAIKLNNRREKVAKLGPVNPNSLAWNFTRTQFKVVYFASGQEEGLWTIPAANLEK